MKLTIPLVLGLSLFTIYATNSSVSTLVPIIAGDFGLAPFTIGLITGAYGWVYALFQIPAGILADRYEPKAIVTIALAGFFLATLLFAFSGGSTSLIASRGLMGATAAFVFIASLTTIITKYPGRERGKALGAFTSIGLSGISVMNFVLPSAIASTSADWRLLYLSMGVITVVASAVVLAAMPARLNQRSQAQADAVTARVGLVAAMGQTSRNGYFWVQNLISFIYFGSFFGVLYWLPSYALREGLGMSLGGLAVTLLGLGTVIGCSLMGWLLDRVGSALVLRLSLAAYVFFLACVALAPLIGYAGYVMLAASFMVGLTFGGITANVTIIGSYFEAQLLGTAYGIYNTFSWAGSAFFPTLIGLLLSYGLSFEYSFLPMVAMSVFALMLSALPIKTK